MFQRYNTTRHQAHNPTVPPMAPTTPPAGPPRHPLEGLLDSVARVPEQLAGLSAELGRRLRELEAERGRYSEHEYGQVRASIEHDVGSRARAQAEMAGGLAERIRRGIAEAEARQPQEADDAGAVARVKALVDAGHRPEEVAEFLADDPAGARAFASSGGALYAARLPREALASPEGREHVAAVRTLAERTAERHLPLDLQQARAVGRDLHLALSSVVRHGEMVSREVAGKPVDRIGVGLLDVMEAHDAERAERPIETGMEPDAATA